MKSVVFLLMALLLAPSSKAAGRIRTRTVPGHDTREFFNTANLERFVPRGHNYVRLANQLDPWHPGSLPLYHSTFNPGLYDSVAAETALGEMRRLGYNVVRVFINDWCVGLPEGQSGLNPEYLANVADFLQRADRQDVRVMLTLLYLPRTGGYYPPPNNPQIEDLNNCYLKADFIAAKQHYVADFIHELKKRSAPLAAIFSYNIENEVYFLETAKPLSLTNGQILTANGLTYDMASAADRQQMMDANLVNWVNCVAQAVREADPETMVTVGFFSPAAVSGDDPRMIRTYWAIADAAQGGASVDFIDLHPYLGLRDIAEEMASFEIPSRHEKPLVMGEFGAWRPAFTNIAAIALALRDFQALSAGRYGFSGWLYWTWDSEGQSDWPSAVSNHGLIADILSPVVRPSPQDYTGPVKNLGLSLSNGCATLRWCATDRTVFTLWRRDQWGAGEWQAVSPTNQIIPEAVTILEARDPTPGQTKARFYRIEAK